MTAARLNVFQRLVRQWDTVHPYNAAQVLRLRGKPDLLTIRRAWHSTLATLGLGPVCVRGRQFHFEAVNGNAVKYNVPLVAAEVPPCEHISAELKRSFDNDAELPLRPFIVEEEGVVY